MAEEFAAAHGCRSYEVFKRRNSYKRLAQGDEFARAGLTKRDAAGETFEVLDGTEFFANFAADDGLLDEVGYGVEACFDGLTIDPRAENPGTEKASAHAGHGDVERGDESGRCVFAGVVGKNGTEEFKIADGDGIEDESVVLFIVAD